jgi:hypothetical protein
MRERERAGLKARDADEKFRARTILFHLQRLRGLPAGGVTEPDDVLDWLPREAWYATQALKPGVFRVLTAVAALDETPELEPERVSWALHLFEEERLKLEFERTESLAIALYRRRPDAENVERLARVHTWRGHADAALNVLGEALASSTERAVASRLHLARARAADAGADERAALADYGAALAFGSSEAALDLGTAALGAGQGAKAAFLADLVASEAPGRDEAQLLYGLAWLPRATQPPAGGAHRAPRKGTLGDE